jgi:hypothetical protein
VVLHLHRLTPTHAFQDTDVRRWFGTLGKIIGRSMSEQSWIDVSPVSDRLLLVSRTLTDVAAPLEGHETGLRSNLFSFSGRTGDANLNRVLDNSGDISDPASA